MKSIYSDRLEGDDIVYLTHKYLKPKIASKIIIITNDNDFLQLIDRNVLVFNMQLKELKNRGYRDAIVDLNFKAIYGDKSDNIPKIGPCITKEKAIALAQLSKTELNSYLIDNNLMDNYEFNMNLISFENIPQKYIDIYIINNKETKLVLYVYDAFVLDVSKQDKEEIKQILTVFKDKNLQIKTSYGPDYNTLQPLYIYDRETINTGDVNNKLFCTFVPLNEVDSFIKDISSEYTILYNKIFVLHIKSNDEYVCTYNVDQPNINNIPENTILVHRKKETNTLYTINALNELIKSLNEGIVDINYRINWQHYKNTIVLTQQGDLKLLRTKIFQIVEL